MSAEGTCNTKLSSSHSTHPDPSSTSTSTPCKDGTAAPHPWSPATETATVRGTYRVCRSLCHTRDSLWSWTPGQCARMDIPCYCIPLYQRQTHFSVSCAGLRTKWLSKQYLDHVAPTELSPTFVSSGTTIPLPALTFMKSSKDSPLVSQVLPHWIIYAFKNNEGTKFERAVMVTKTKHWVHQKCGETTNRTLTSVQGNL